MIPPPNSFYFTVLIDLFIVKTRIDPIGQSRKLLALNFKEFFVGMYTWKNLGLFHSSHKTEHSNLETVILWNKIPFPDTNHISTSIHSISTNVNFVFTTSQIVLAKKVLVYVIASLSMHVTYLYRSKIEFANLKVKRFQLKEIGALWFGSFILQSDRKYSLEQQWNFW